MAITYQVLQDAYGKHARQQMRRRFLITVEVSFRSSTNKRDATVLTWHERIMSWSTEFACCPPSSTSSKILPGSLVLAAILPAIQAKKSWVWSSRANLDADATTVLLIYYLATEYFFAGSSAYYSAPGISKL